MSHNIEGDVHLNKKKLPTFCPNLVFWLNLILQAMKLVQVFSIVDLLGPSMLYLKGVKF